LNVRDTEKQLKKIKNLGSNVKKISIKDRFLGDLEKSLSTKLMAKVTIHGSSNKGVIELHYHSMDELNRLSGTLLDEIM